MRTDLVHRTTPLLSLLAIVVAATACPSRNDQEKSQTTNDETGGPAKTATEDTGSAAAPDPAPTKSDETGAATPADAAAGPSLMPKEDYSVEGGEFDLVNLRESPLDAKIEALAAQFITWDDEKREATRATITSLEFYTVMQYARRATVRCLRQKSAAICGTGLNAIAMIDEERVDPQAVKWAAGLLQHAAGRLGPVGKELGPKAAALATKAVAEMIKAQPTDAPLSGLGFAEVETPDGIGLIASAGRPYAPTFALTQLVLDVSASLDDERYLGNGEVATDVPAIFFEDANRKEARPLLKQALAVGKVYGTPKAAVTPEPQNHIHFQWIAELPSAKEAKQLADFGGRTFDNRFAVTRSTGKLFLLVVVGSSTVSDPPIENLESAAAIADKTLAMMAKAKPAG